MGDEVLDGRHLSSFWRVAARDAGLLAETYESSCAFIHVNNRVDQEPCAAETPLWRNGANHLMVDLTDSTRCVSWHMHTSAEATVFEHYTCATLECFDIVGLCDTSVRRSIRCGGVSHKLMARMR